MTAGTLLVLLAMFLGYGLLLAAVLAEGSGAWDADEERERERAKAS